MTDVGNNGGQLTNASAPEDADPSAAIIQILESWEDFKLFQLTKFYRDRLEQAVEGGVHGVSSALTCQGLFSGQEHGNVTGLADKGELADSSKLLLSLVTEKGSPARRVMWETFVKMRNAVPKLDKILKEIQENGFVPYGYIKVTPGLSSVPDRLKDVQQKHRETLRAQTDTLRVNTILKNATVGTFPLVDRYVELTVISTVRDRRLVEHELLARGRDHEERRQEHLRRELEKIRTDQLFQSSFSRSKSKSGSSAAVAGVPGIGKTTMVQKIIYDWATGKIYQHFQFVFRFRFRDLNTINCTINLWNLILFFYPYFRNVLEKLWENPEGLLFIFDGLDEFKDRIDFTNSQRDTESQHMCTDPEFRCKVSDIVYSLIQHKLLPGCSVLVTTRPTALYLLEKAEISVWTEILGFVGEQRKEYFSRYFEDQTVAAAVFKHVEQNEILYTMSYNPSYCWILGLALDPFFTQRDRDPQRVPKTITQLYSYYIYNILKNHGRKIESPRDVLLRVGQMAFTGVSESNIVFTDGDLIKYNLQPSQFLSGFLSELLEREDAVQNVVYTFPHLTVQEFVAALAQFLIPHPGHIRKLLSEAHSTRDGRFEIFLRFVAGLSSPGSAQPLEEFLGPFPHETTRQVIDWVKEEVKRQIANADGGTGDRKLLNALHYLFESQNREMAEITLGSVETLSFSYLRLTPTDCAVLSHVIGFCETIKRLDLQNCHIECEGLQRLGPGLQKCQELSLAKYPLGDSEVRQLSAALKKPGCQVQKMQLDNNSLTASCADDLVSAVSAIRSLTELELGYNKLGDSGVRKLMAEALRNPQCKIQKLGLSFNGLTPSCAEDLAYVLSTNRSLKTLNLSSNDLGDSGLKLVSAALRDPGCKLQKLCLWAVGLTASCAEDLVSTLTENHSLTELELGFNKLGDSGVKLLSTALKKPDCKLQELGLDNNGLTASCAKELASALRRNSSLMRLELGFNNLGDSGVRLLSAALSVPDCKIQRLRLRAVGLTDSCTADLLSTLGTNSSLKDLDLCSNSFTDQSVPALRCLILTQKSLEHIQLVGNQFASDGEKQLRLLQGTRRRLSVFV